VTHRPEEQPDGGEFRFVSGVETAVDRAREAAGAEGCSHHGGADVIRQALDAGLVDELSIVVAPVILGGGKRLFDGFSQASDLEHLGLSQSPFATLHRLPLEEVVTTWSTPGAKAAVVSSS
jgi:dihydrofolate reductase